MSEHLDRLRAFKFWLDRGQAVVNSCETKDALALLEDYERLLRESSMDPKDPNSKAYQFQEVMAVLHGDGGHYLVAHGPKKAADDAIAKYYTRITELERLREEAKSDRLVVEEARRNEVKATRRYTFLRSKFSLEKHKGMGHAQADFKFPCPGPLPILDAVVDALCASQTVCRRCGKEVVAGRGGCEGAQHGNIGCLLNNSK